MIKAGIGTACVSGLILSPLVAGAELADERERPPNILYAISDDQSWIHAGAYGFEEARTLEERPEERPFFFWYGAREPHPGTIRANLGSGVAAGFDLEAIEVPPFLPDVPEVRSHIADYLRMIEVFDENLGAMLAMLEEAGELDNTIVIVTSDHGMGFPRAKANLYEYGVRVPLAVRWGAEVPAGRVVDDLIDLIDITATIYDATGVGKPEEYPISGRTMLGLLRSGKEGIVEPERDAVYLGRERHTSARHDNLGYPIRAIRTQEYLYIHNFYPDRWPAGAPQALRDDGSFYPRSHGGNAFADIGDSPTKTFLVENSDHEKYREYFLLAVGRRPAEELYDIRNDPGCLNNLAGHPEYADIRLDLAKRLETHLEEFGDPRIVGPDPEIFETYLRYGGIRRYPPPEREPEEWSRKIAP